MSVTDGRSAARLHGGGVTRLHSGSSAGPQGLGATRLLGGGPIGCTAAARRLDGGEALGRTAAARLLGRTAAGQPGCTAARLHGGCTAARGDGGCKAAARVAAQRLHGDGGGTAGRQDGPPSGK